MVLHQSSNIINLLLQQLRSESQNLPEQKKEIVWHFLDVIVCEIFV